MHNRVYFRTSRGRDRLGFVCSFVHSFIRSIVRSLARSSARTRVSQTCAAGCHTSNPCRRPSNRKFIDPRREGGSIARNFRSSSEASVDTPVGNVTDTNLFPVFILLLLYYSKKTVFAGADGERPETRTNFRLHVSTNENRQ